jgi:putative FmdB family regulatory protein
MPTYEYLCEKCGVFEQFHSINTSLTLCPDCGLGVRRLISQNCNIIFKGSGFHVTDNRSSDYSKKAANENPSSSSTTTSTTSTNSSSSSSTSPSKSESKAS